MEWLHSPATTYAFDDFGNTVAVTAAWSYSGSGYGVARLQHDARGLVVRKATPMMSAMAAWWLDLLEYSYDGLGRPLALVHRFGSSPQDDETLWALSYDSTGTPDNSCPQPANTLGRLREREDSFGKTWYQYDAWGRVVKEIRLRAGESTCSGAGPDDTPHTSYTWSPNGALTSLTMPYGRKVTYTQQTYSGGYSGVPTGRVGAISVQKWSGSAWTDDTAWQDLIENVEWEPYGGLRGYQINAPDAGTASAVEYLAGDSQDTPSGSDCAAPSGNDKTGNMRALYVSRLASGGWSPGTGTGNVLRRTVTWQADMPERVDTCLLGATTARREVYAYDSALRLTSATRPSGNRAAAGGPYESRSWTFTSRGNRERVMADGVGWDSWYTYGSELPDWVQYMGPADGGVDAGTNLTLQYSYDIDGRLNQRSGKAGTMMLEPGVYYGPQGSSALDSVYKAITVPGGMTGLTYSYFYDANNRRRLKVYPTDVRDEYFHSLGSSQLLLDVGNDNVDTASYHPTDEYVWLGGRPVLVVRGRLETDYSREEDESSAACGRNGRTESCGLYFPVTDEGGRVVVVLNAGGLVAGVGEYEPYGHVNRATVDAETEHPYGADLDVTLLSMQQPRTGLQLSMRAHFAWVDTEVLEDGGVAADFAALKEGSSTLAGPYFGNNAGAFWSDWVSPSGDTVDVKFASDSQDCCWGSCSPGCPQDGVSIDAWEYKKAETGASHFFVPFRLPGQYHDEETDFFENWNRFYDPTTGRYLSPEPLLQYPVVAKQEAMHGRGMPAYAYAFNNPVRYTDETGLWPPTTCGPGGVACEETRAGGIVGRDAAEAARRAAAAAAAAAAALKACDSTVDQATLDRLDACNAGIASCKQCCDEKIRPVASGQYIPCLAECADGYGACMKGRSPTQRCWPGGSHNP